MNKIKLILAKPILTFAALATVGAGAGVGALASAQTATSSDTAAVSTTSTNTNTTRPDRAPGVHGTITAISGNTITVEDKGFGANATAVTYTVDASAATVMVGRQGAAPTTGSVSSLKVGDMIGVEGTVSSTSVTATKIMSGMIMGGFGHGGPGMGMGRGHGAAGTVSAISGNTITVTGDNGTSYTVDASKATVSKVVTESVSDIAVGDRIEANGTLSGTTVTANHIMAGIPAPQTTATSATQQ